MVRRITYVRTEPRHLGGSSTTWHDQPGRPTPEELRERMQKAGSLDRQPQPGRGPLLTVEQIRKARELKVTHSREELAEMFEVSVTVIARATRGIGKARAARGVRAKP